MKKHTITLFLLVLCYYSYCQELPAVINDTDFVIGKTVTIRSAILNEDRTLNIYLPAGYHDDSLKTYPVIYLLDGSADEDFIHIAGLVQFATFPWIDMMPESIVVGITNTDRKRDFTPPSSNILDQKDFPTSGKAANFISFVKEELQPFVNHTYRTTKETTLIGQSLGGLLATLILHEQPELFDHYIIVSPSLWWNDEKLLRKKITFPISDRSIYIAVGKEGEVMERTAKALYEKLLSTKTDDISLYFEYMPDKTHGDALHMAVYHALERIFRKK